MSTTKIEQQFELMLSNIKESPFKNLIIDYQDALVKEQRFLDESYHPAFFAKEHPLRATHALFELLREHCNMEKRRPHGFNQKLANFQREATNSKFYPGTRLLAQLLAGALMTFALVSLVGFVLGFPFPAVVFVAAAIAVVALFPVYSMLTWKFSEYSFQPIYESEKTGNQLFKTFQSFEKQAEEVPFNQISMESF